MTSEACPVGYGPNILSFVDPEFVELGTSGQCTPLCRSLERCTEPITQGPLLRELVRAVGRHDRPEPRPPPENASFLGLLISPGL